jgi:hypothetical protein
LQFAVLDEVMLCAEAVPIASVKSAAMSTPAIPSTGIARPNVNLRLRGSNMLLCSFILVSAAALDVPNVIFRSCQQ